VARIAGLPEQVIDRAKEILDNLEGEDLDEAGRPRLAHTEKPKGKQASLQLNLFGAQDQRLKKRLKSLDLSSMTPLEALIELNKLIEYIDKESL
jgi:DNA mismatch repair protein MutS